jgi:hypothetical protein
MEIFRDLGNRPMCVIRFNPDQYFDENNVLVKSCWSYSKIGLAIINRSKRDEWKKRLEALKIAIQNNIENIPQKEIEITSIYFDK